MADNLRYTKWETKLADNGWIDWQCFSCGYTENHDIHVVLNYKKCPSCGRTILYKKKGK